MGSEPRPAFLRLGSGKGGGLLTVSEGVPYGILRNWGPPRPALLRLGSGKGDGLLAVLEGIP